jgi:microsomal dipeptidase-like Zn-dependent dipeptidase
MKEEKDGDTAERHGHKFNNWNINLCDEDVINIYKSKGIIGINLDQRVLGVSKNDVNKEETHAGYVWQNIKGMMLAVIDSNDPEITSKKEITDTFCLGTDFDGFIDPVNKYPTVMDFKQLAEDLVQVINNDPDKDTVLFGTDVEVFVKKICFDNAHDFVVANFN